MPQSYKINLIKCLLLHAFKICSNWPQFTCESTQIKNVFIKLGYPNDRLDYLINSFKKDINNNPLVQYGPTKRKIFLKLPYIGQLSKRIKKELNHLIINYFLNVSLQLIFCNNYRIRNLFNKAIKPKLPFCFISHVVYKVDCFDCVGSYIGKTKHTLLERIAQNKSCLKGKGFPCLADHAMKTGHNII